MFSRLDELKQQKVIRLSELPLAGKIRAVYKSIGRKPHAPRAASCKHGRVQVVMNVYQPQGKRRPG